MLTRLRQRAWILGALVIAAVTAFGLLHSGGAKYRQIDPARKLQDDLQRERAIRLEKWRHREVCPSGHKTEIVMGQTHLYVDMRAIGLLQIEEFQDVPSGCPTGPIFARGVSFSHLWNTEELGAIFQRYALQLNHMDLDRFRPGYYVGPPEIPENPDLRIAVAGAGFVDDITKQSPVSSPLSKGYRVQHLSPLLDDAPATIFMICHGSIQENRWRYCQTTYRLGDVRVEYEFRQDTDFPNSNVPDIPVKEPEGFLAVDASVRTWIGDMLRAGDGAQ